MHNSGQVRRLAMEFADESNRIRVYRAKQVRQWRIAFHCKEVQSLFDELIHRRWGQARWQPKIDVLKIAAGYVVEADIPGVDEESVEVDVRGCYLKIEGRRFTSRSRGRSGMLVCERPEGPFSRVIEFAEVVEGFSLQRSLKKGVLTLILTKA
jgi:HSP20 family protein